MFPAGSNPQPPNYQSDAHPTEPSRPTRVICELDHGKRVLIAHMLTAEVQSSKLGIYTVLPEPMLFAHVSGKPRENFSQRTRHGVSLRVQACTLKDVMHIIPHHYCVPVYTNGRKTTECIQSLHTICCKVRDAKTHLHKYLP